MILIQMNDLRFFGKVTILSGLLQVWGGTGFLLVSRLLCKVR